MALPGVSPILIAALPIPEKNSADDLVRYTLDIIRGLTSWSVNVASYACDGTEVERKVQCLLKTHTDSVKQYTIPSPNKDDFGLSIDVLIFDNKPIITIQDSKHGLKTFRNNVFSGARFLVFGDFVCLFRHIHQIAFEAFSPLYHRDIEKLDKQDDNAASRLFSSATLDFIIQRHPEWVGLAIYLFVFGELIDAYQNRNITHRERLKLALRAYYFINMWRSFLHKDGYNITHYFISREAFDITQILIKGLIGLILIHRDYYTSGSEPFPLLPWLHSTEPCEHVFGNARQVIKDFTLLNFYYMIQKLQVKIHESFMLATSSNPKLAAQGYNHTYLDSNNINLHNLATYPTDEELADIPCEAMDEAESLVNLLGIPLRLLHSSQVPEEAQSMINDDNINIHEDEDDTDNTITNPAHLLHSVLQSPEAREWAENTLKTEDLFANLISATTALSIDDMMTM